MKAFIGSKKGTSKVFGTSMIVVVAFAFGLTFFNFVTSNIDSMKATFNTQMKNLLLASFSANSTHIVAFIKNTANQVCEITHAYLNSMLAILQEGKVTIQPISIGEAIIVGSFAEGNAYTVKLSSIFSVAVTFTVTI
jgi:hypothetical protein